MNWANPDNVLDLVAYGWYGLVLIAVAAVPSFFAARNKRDIKSVYDSINNRPTSIRDDLDKALTAIEALAHDVRAIRVDLMTEEDRRRRDVADLENRIGRHRKQED